MPNNNKPVKLNLHAHSNISKDSTIQAEQLQQAFAAGTIDQIAITDHDDIRAAKELQAKFGPERIIVGEEITTNKGKHIIGLFLNKFVPRGLSAERICELIRNQGGLIYL